MSGSVRQPVPSEVRPGAPLGRWHDGLLVVWLALIAADRVDFLSGSGPFRLTPFFLLTPLVLVSELLRLSSTGGRVRIPPGAKRYALAAVGLLLVVLVSVFTSMELPLAAKRGANLALLVTVGFLTAVAVADRPRGHRILVHGAKVALVVALAFTALQTVWWLSGSTEPLRVGAVSVRMDPSLYAGIIPRFAGPVNDQNQAGALYLFCLFALLRWGSPGWRRRGWIAVAVVLLVGTLSRSAGLAAVGMVVVWFLDSRDIRVSRSAALAGCAAVGLLLAWMLLDPGGRAEAASALEPLSRRFSLSEGSAQVHLGVVERGIEVGTSSLKRAATGIGYGNAHLVLQDFYAGNRYGNFHSLYVTMFAEAGAFALLLIVLLLGYPLLRGGPLRPLVAALALFNVFYQVNASPLFWFVLALAWITTD